MSDFNTTTLTQVTDYVETKATYVALFTTAPTNTTPGTEIAPLAAPAAPVPTTATTGGTVAAGTYPVVVTYVNGAGETVGSAAGSVTTTGTTSTITVPSPAASTGATGWYAYVGQAGAAASTATRQQAAGSPTAIGTALTLTAPPTSTGATAPTTNTTAGSPAYARKAITYTDGSAGQTSGTVTFDVPAGVTVRGTGLYDAATAGNYVGGKVCADDVFSSQGTLQVTINIATA